MIKRLLIIFGDSTSKSLAFNSTNVVVIQRHNNKRFSFGLHVIIVSNNNSNSKCNTEVVE